MRVKYNKYEHREREKRMKLQGDSTFDDWKSRKFIKKQLINSKGNICAICGKPIENMKDCTIDHIIPVSKGGMTTVENCQLAHTKCNQLKGNSTTMLTTLPKKCYD